jgi:hypothetical protein
MTRHNANKHIHKLALLLVVEAQDAQILVVLTASLELTSSGFTDAVT